MLTQVYARPVCIEIVTQTAFFGLVINHPFALEISLFKCVLNIAKTSLSSTMGNTSSTQAKAPERTVRLSTIGPKLPKPEPEELERRFTLVLVRICEFKLLVLTYQNLRNENVLCGAEVNDKYVIRVSQWR